MLLWIPGHSRIQGNKDADTSATKRSSNPVHHPKPAIPVPSCVARLKIKVLLNKMHSKYWAAMPDMRQPKLLIEGPLEKLSRDLVALDRNQQDS
jgi:hypothetical protein